MNRLQQCIYEARESLDTEYFEVEESTLVDIADIYAPVDTYSRDLYINAIYEDLQEYARYQGLIS